MMFRGLIAMSMVLVFAQTISFQAHAQQLPLDRILQQQNQQEQLRKTIEAPTIIQKPKVGEEQKEVGKTCIQIDLVEINGATKLTKKQKEVLTTDIFGKCIYTNQINSVIEKITNFYVSKGFISARAYFVEYDYKSKKLVLKVAEGAVSSIKLNNIKPSKDSERNDKIIDKSQHLKSLEDFRKKSQIFFAFPTSKGEVLNIKDAEQGVNQINRLRSNSAVIDIRPAEIEGESDIVVNNYKSGSLEPSISYDNSGSKSSGIYNTTYSLSKDNLLGINDNLSYSKILSTNSNTGIFSFSMPLGYYTLSYSNANNHYTSYTENGVKISGTSDNNDFSISRLLYRTKRTQIDLTTNLNLRNQTRDINGDTDISSQRLTTGRIGINYRLQLQNSALLLGAKYSKGLRANSAIDDNDSKYPLFKSSPRAQFEKYNYNLGFYANPLPYLSYSLQADAQYSPDSLYVSEMLYVGGNEFSVRGLKYSGLSGSKGAYARNEIALALNRIEFLSRPQSSQFAASSMNFVRSITPYAFYDMGIAKQVSEIASDAKMQSISGAGVGARINTKYLSAGIAYAKNINAPDYVLAQNYNRKDALYFSMSARVAFF